MFAWFHVPGGRQSKNEKGKKEKEENKRFDTGKSKLYYSLFAWFIFISRLMVK